MPDWSEGSWSTFVDCMLLLLALFGGFWQLKFAMHRVAFIESEQLLSLKLAQASKAAMTSVMVFPPKAGLSGTCTLGTLAELVVEVEVEVLVDVLVLPTETVVEVEVEVEVVVEVDGGGV